MTWNGLPIVTSKFTDSEYGRYIHLASCGYTVRVGLSHNEALDKLLLALRAALDVKFRGDTYGQHR